MAIDMEAGYTQVGPLRGSAPDFRFVAQSTADTKFYALRMLIVPVLGPDGGPIPYTENGPHETAAEAEQYVDGLPIPAAPPPPAPAPPPPTTE